jgi:hypothetical protein
MSLTRAKTGLLISIKLQLHLKRLPSVKRVEKNGNHPRRLNNIMQHNSWKKDKESLSELAQKVITESWQDESGLEYPDSPKAWDGETDQDVEPSSVLERLEKIPGAETILADLEDIINNIDSLEAEDGKIDAADLGIQLARLRPDTSKGSAFV